jgi:CubicO group peptidase (beta-lactamase class C family)
MTLHDNITAAMARERVPGAALALIECGELSWTAGFGVRSVSAAEPQAVDAETVFAIASLSKPPFAALVLGLAERGVLDLDTPVSEVDPRPYSAYGLDPTDERLGRITARHILCHSSGLGNWAPTDTGRVNFEPGTRWLYSGEGYLYLQRAIEQLTGLPLPTLAERELFGPLGLRLTSYAWREEWTDVAEGHGRSSTGGHRFPTAFGAFSLHTTAAEYAQLIAAFIRDQVVAGMFEPAIVIDGPLAWGLGFGLFNGIFWHWGDMGDFQCAVAGSRELRRALVCLTNSEHGLAVCADTTSQFLGERYALPIREVIRRQW